MFVENPHLYRLLTSLLLCCDDIARALGNDHPEKMQFQAEFSKRFMFLVDDSDQSGCLRQTLDYQKKRETRLIISFSFAFNPLKC